MKRSKAQLHAISRYYSDKRDREQRERLEQLGLDQVFKFQTVYASMRGFLDLYEECTTRAKQWHRTLQSAADGMRARAKYLADRNAKNSDGTPHRDIERLSRLADQIEEGLKNE